MKNTFRLINVIYRDARIHAWTAPSSTDAPKKRTGDRTDHPMNAISKRDSAIDRSNFCLVENETNRLLPRYGYSNYSTRRVLDEEN